METTLARARVLAAAAEAPRGIAGEEFDQIVRVHQQRIHRILLALVRDPDAADTLTQECFLRAYRHREGFRGDASVGTWLVRIAVNLAADHGRNRRHSFWRKLVASSDREDSVLAADSLPDPKASPERELAAREELQAVWSAVDGLSPQQRAAFVLRFAEEMTLDEIAQAMALEVGTVKAHLARAVGTLRRQLKERGSDARTPQR